MAKKRKEPPQPSSTLLDFFGKGSALPNTRDVKKHRTKDPAPPRKVVTTVKREVHEEVIVIDSSDEDDVVLLEDNIRPVARPASKTLQNPPVPRNSLAEYDKTMVRHATPVLADRSSNVKIEPDLSRSWFGHPSELLAPPPPEQAEGDNRGPSPFGFPSILAIQEQETGAVAHASVHSVPLLDCSHDGLAGSVPKLLPQDQDVSQVGEALLGDGDWDTGDDELEFVDVIANVKEEEDDSVDIDLTVDDDSPAAAEGQPVESCPICERVLVGMSTSEIHDHVDECLNSLPDTKPSACEFASSTSSSSKPLQPLSSLRTPQLKSMDIDELPDVSVKQEAGDPNVFSMLMSSHKENEAWKEASAVEDSTFRSTRGNGARRKAPFYKVMQGMPIAVDAFRYGTIPNVTAYFLTHAHSDHYTNLSAKWDSGPIYCSECTANLIIHMLGVDPKWVHPLPMDAPTTIPNTGGVQVTLIEANHCPGSCLFLFEGKQTVNSGDSAYKSSFVGSAKVFRYLHCGDFRACPQHVLHPAVKGKHIDHVYLDTTYLDPKYCFPPQPLVVSACAELAKRLVQGRSLEDATGDAKPRTMNGWFTRAEKSEKGKDKAAAPPDKVLVVVGTYSIGKERIVKAIAKALDTKVYCDARKAAILRCQSDPELHSLLTTDPLAAGVHLVPLAVIASDRLKVYMERWKGHYSKAVGFRPTGWTFTPPSGTDMLPSISTVISRSQSRTFTHANLQPMRNSISTLQVYGVPYSEHSSFFELTCFALSFDWGRMIATVNVGSEASRGKMSKWVERWETEKKKQGKVEVVGHRTHEYW